MAQRKRRYNPSEEILPIEKLYREKQCDYSKCGGFVAEEGTSSQRKKDNFAGSVPPPPNADCRSCERPVLNSWLYENFLLPVCEECRDPDGQHKLMTKTEAKNEFLLKDCDLDARQPPLKYVSRKNPHNPRYGDMKLYLKCQVVERALLVHGSMEDMDTAKDRRQAAKDSRQENAFGKRLKELRQHMRGVSTKKAKVSSLHEHIFCEEKNDGDDNFSKECTVCGYILKYEKM